jgi:complement component 1 Q subcomponent-binding protein
MSAIRALRQVAVPLVARRSVITAATVPRVGGMRVASLASSRVIASRGFASSARRFGEGSSEQFFFFFGQCRGRRRAGY